jgi:multidrug resistance efflux pump
MPNNNAQSRSGGRWWWKAALLAVVLLVTGYLVWRPAGKASHGSTFTARRGLLPITVVENGSIEAQEAQEVRVEVKGWQRTKILSIVEEGYQVTEQDTKTNKVLIELDPSEIKKDLTTLEIDFQGKQAALIDAQQAYEIQLAQNKSDIKSAEQKARFARLDSQKFLGDQVADEVAKQLGLDENLAKLTAANGLEPSPENEAAVSTNQPAPPAGSPAPAAPGGTPAAAASPSQVAELMSGASAVTNAGVKVTVALSNPAGLPPGSSPAAPQPATAPSRPPDSPEPAKAVLIDYSQYAKVELLGDGEAQQKLREARDTLLLAEKERSGSKTKLDGTERLCQKGFVTKTELDTARLEYEQVDLKVKKSATALNLFIKYEFPKQAEELVSKYEEGVRLLERTRKEAISKLAQARAKLKSAEQQFKVVTEHRKDLLDQLDKCTICAKKTGLVIYGGTGDSMNWYGEERIRDGAAVRERQPLITIPDMSRMAIKVKIHESHIKKVKKGMKAFIRVDAQADKQLNGEVSKVGVLPDSQNRWMNPDLKVYNVTVNIEGAYDWLKPGMSAKVEILVNELKDVVHVPIQAITPSGKEQVCYVVKGGAAPERRVVETGEYSDEFIEIKKGLKEREVVLLRSPEGAGQAAEQKAGETGSKGAKPEPQTPRPTPAPTPPRLGPA